MTRQELWNAYQSARHCKRGYCCQQGCGEPLVELGYNAGYYGWNWTAYIGADTNTLYISYYRNLPDYIKEK